VGYERYRRPDKQRSRVTSDVNDEKDRRLSLEEWMNIPTEELRERSGELRNKMVIPANHIRCVGVRVMPKRWWVRLLEFLGLRRKMYNVSYQFKVTPDVKGGT
jgi:hypothetical protein